MSIEDRSSATMFGEKTHDTRSSDSKLLHDGVPEDILHGADGDKSMLGLVVHDGLQSIPSNDGPDGERNLRDVVHERDVVEVFHVGVPEMVGWVPRQKK